MLVRKLTCSVCGGNKVNELTTGYIYCDYCSSLMGYDMQKMQGEAKNVFSPQNLSKKLQKDFISATQELAQHIESKNAEGFIETQLKIHQIEFELFPTRFSPKLKQPAHQKKYIDFYRLYWNESIENGYFEKQAESQKKFAELGSKLKTRFENNQLYTEYDENFEIYLDLIVKFTKDSVDETLKMKCIEHYPEPVTSTTSDALYKQALNAYVQQLDSEIVTKVIDKLGFKSEFIEIDPVQTADTNCFVCSTELKVPAGSKSMLCEKCGTTNQFETKEVNCPGCAALFSPENENLTCPYCGSKMMTYGEKQQDKVEQKIEKTTPKKQKRGFFSKLFGKK